MVEKRGDLDQVGYVFGIISIVMAFFTPLAGFVFGIIGLVQSKKQKTSLSKKARTLNIVGMVLSIILFTLSIVATAYLAKIGLNPLV
tara:strand:- start:1224 stop:1484 length:261 start_codon:yes stop_codon:yes gene_type:complete